jgi:CBS domain-containing protein
LHHANAAFEADTFGKTRRRLRVVPAAKLDAALHKMVQTRRRELGADPNISDDALTAAGRVPAEQLEREREAIMTVSTILGEKGREVVTIEPGANLAAAAKLLAEKRIGAVLVLGADRRLVGIMSERDIVQALAARGVAAFDEPVSQTMTRKVETCNESETIGSIMERMTNGKFRHVPVIEQGRLVGIISIGDVVKHRLQEIERESAAMRDYILTA